MREEQRRRELPQPGIRYEVGDEVKEDTVKAETYYKKSCDLGYAEGCDELGTLNQTQKRDSLAIAPKTRGCELGSESACTDLAEAYRTGKGVDQDTPKAVTLYASACKGGDGDSCRQIGKIFKKGEGGIKVDEALALKLFARGCQLEDTDACNDAAKMAKAKHDAASMVKFYRFACQGYDYKSCGLMGAAIGANPALKVHVPNLASLLKEACLDGEDKRSCAASCDLGEQASCKKK